MNLAEDVLHGLALPAPLEQGAEGCRHALPDRRRASPLRSGQQLEALPEPRDGLRAQLPGGVGHEMGRAGGRLGVPTERRNRSAKWRASGSDRLEGTAIKAAVVVPEAAVGVAAAPS